MEDLLSEIISGSAEATPLKKIGMTRSASCAFSKGTAKLYIKDGLLAAYYDRTHKHS